MKNNGDQAKQLRRQAGRWLKELRRRRALTQRELASALDYTYYTFISQIENGVARVPSESLTDWARALDIDQAEFARTLLQYYDPHFYTALFGADRHERETCPG